MRKLLLYSIVFLLCSPPGRAADFAWEQSLTFPPGPQEGAPNPTNGQNIVAHDGKLFAGFASVKDGGYGNYESYVYRKDSAGAPWVLDATFPSGTLRVDSMISVTFVNDEHGDPIPGGPVTKLVAATNKVLAPDLPVRIFVRDDSTGAWIEQQISNQEARNYQARNLSFHRDAVTGADMIFVGCSPAPFGIYAGVYDASVPGGIRWHPDPEQVAETNAGSDKWFGMDEADGKLFASNRWKIYQRNDGAFPSTWTPVAVNETPGGGASENPEMRGLTGVPNPAAVTGWPEDEMLIFSWHKKIWRMRAAPPWTQIEEIDLNAQVAADTGRDDIIYVEAVPNTVLACTKPGESTPTFPIGFQVIFGDTAPGSEVVFPRDIFDPGDMTGVRCGQIQGLYYERDVEGNYGPLRQIVDPSQPDREMVWPRDWAASPFPEEPNVIYCTGYNASVSQRTGNDALGRAWVYQGTPAFATFDVTLDGSERLPVPRNVTIRVYYPRNFSGAAPVILVSHGGDGSEGDRGHTRLPHLGSEYAASGYVAVHLSHLPSGSNAQHRLDRPADVSFVLDQLMAGNVTFPDAFRGTLDFTKIGHAGHSWGAYTAHAVGGGQFDQGNLGDPRVKAICPFSPQGPGGFGAYDNGPGDNTWRGMTIPTCSFVGAVEKDGSYGGGNSMEDWRLSPFMRYSTAGDHYLSVLPGQDHGDIGGSGSPEVQAFLAENSRVFFDVYLKEQHEKVCDIGRLAFFPGTVNSRKFDASDSLPAGCSLTPGDTLSFPSHADTSLREGAPNSNFGTNVVTRVAGGTGGSDDEGLIKFNVSGVEGTVTGAKLRLYNVDVLAGTVAVFATHTGWDETTVTWNTAPPALEQLDSVTDPAAGQYVEWDVTSLVTANGTCSFRLTHTNPAAGQDFRSRDGAANHPELVVTYETGANIAAWRRIHFGTDENSGPAANDADFDFDSLPNLVEYGLRLLPDDASPPHGAAAAPSVTAFRVEPSLLNHLVLELDMPDPPPADVSFEILESEDLRNWFVIARRDGTGPWDNLGSGAPVLLEPPANGRTATAVGSSQTLDSYASRKVFLVLSVLEDAS